MVCMIGYRVWGKLFVEEVLLLWVVEGVLLLEEVVLEVVVCLLEDKVVLLLVEEVVFGSRWEYRMVGIVVWEVLVVLVVEGVGVVEGCSIFVNRLDSKF